jgi:nitroreductase
MPKSPEFTPLSYPHVTDEEVVARARTAYERMRKRRTVRDFSDRPVPREAIEAAIRAAGTAPSGANQQPWTFVAISDPETKKAIRHAAEDEEREFYERRAPEEWLEALSHLGTDEHKPFLETAPWLIAVFAQQYGLRDDGTKTKHYYVQKSVGIALGMLIATLHEAGLATLTHTPSPMGFLSRVLNRPENERAYLLLAVGHPAEGAEAPRTDKNPPEHVGASVEAHSRTAAKCRGRRTRRPPPLGRALV